MRKEFAIRTDLCERIVVSSVVGPIGCAARPDGGRPLRTIPRCVRRNFGNLKKKKDPAFAGPMGGSGKVILPKHPGPVAGP